MNSFVKQLSLIRTVIILNLLDLLLILHLRLLNISFISTSWVVLLLKGLDLGWSLAVMISFISRMLIDITSMRSYLGLLIFYKGLSHKLLLLIDVYILRGIRIIFRRLHDSLWVSQNIVSLTGISLNVLILHIYCRRQWVVLLLRRTLNKRSLL